MAKKKVRETGIENYYDLKIDKIDELVAALKGETPADEPALSMNISDCTGVECADGNKRGKEKTFDPYRVDRLSAVPAWIKACFIKFWFAGLVCYFIMWGIMIADTLDAIVLTGAVLGVVVDILVNPLFRYMESDRREYNAYMMFPFPFKAFWTFFANIIYYVIVMFCVNYAYYGVNQLINFIAGTENLVHVGVEPLLFGVFALLADMAFIGIKDLAVFLFKKSRCKETANV